MTIYFQAFCDEGDILASAKFMTQDRMLYRDIFSHHFPFPYYLMRVIFSLFPYSIFTARMTALVFDLLAIILTMFVSRQYLPIALAFMSFRIISIGFLATPATYHRFSGVCIFCFFVIVLCLLLKLRKPTAATSVALGIFSSIAFLSDPTAAIPIGVGFLFYILLRPGMKRLAITAGIFFSSILLMASILAATQSLAAFYDQAILFNRTTYARYYTYDVYRYAQWREQSLSCLQILNPRFFTCDRSFHFLDDQSFDNSMFTGFLYRACVLCLIAGLLLRKHYLSALYVYSTSVCLLVRSQGGFQIIHFVWISLFSGFFFIFDAIPADTARSLRILHSTWKLIFRNGMSTIEWSLRIVISLMLIVLLLSVHLLTQSIKPQLTYEANFQIYENMAQTVERLTFGDRGVAFASYPGATHAYGFCDNPPLSRYTFLWPWIAERGMDEILDELKSKDAVIHIPGSGTIWYYRYEDYMSPLYDYLHHHCTEIEKSWYCCNAQEE